MRKILFTACALVLLGSGFASQSQAVILDGGENSFFFNNFENVYDSAGNFKAPGSALAVGDTFLGIFNVQNIDNENGDTIFAQNPFLGTGFHQISGVFAQRIESIDFAPDNFSGQTVFPHITLAAATITTFTKGADVVSTAGLLAAGEIFAFFEQQGVGSTAFTSGGTSTLAGVSAATDGTKIMTFGYSPGADGVYGLSLATSADDTGYMYSHAPGITPTSGNVGEAFLGLNLVYNGTGYTFNQINDINETEVGDLPTPKLNDLVGTSELEVNAKFFSGLSPWAFASNDPVIMSVVVPEPASLGIWAVISGAVALGAIRRRRLAA